MKCSLVEVKPSRHELKPIMTNPHESERKMFGEKLFSSHSEQKKRKLSSPCGGMRRDEKLKRHWNRINSMKLFNKMLTNTPNIYRSFSRLASLYGSDDLTILRNLLGSLSSFLSPLSHKEKTFIIIIVNITYQTWEWNTEYMCDGGDYVTERLLANRSFMIPLRHIIESECHVLSED